MDRYYKGLLNSDLSKKTVKSDKNKRIDKDKKSEYFE